MSFETDLNAFLDTDEHAVSATYNSTTVKVIFDNLYESESGIEGTHPVIQGKASDFSGAVQGSTIIISGTTYVMKELQPDGNGWLIIMLHKQ
jgi:hypothetical protein